MNQHNIDYPLILMGSPSRYDWTTCKICDAIIDKKLTYCKECESKKNATSR